MTGLDVRIVRLEPLRVVASHDFGKSPEEIAIGQLLKWMETQGIDPTKGRFFGFNNPSPSAGSPNYGYEQWLVLEGDDITVGEGLEIKDFPGGLYAVTASTLEDIGLTWKKLARWCEESRYELAHHQWLEEALTSLTLPPKDIRFNLYAPIAE
jgi:DNA gyrase inhibitor GyrI